MRAALIGLGQTLTLALTLALTTSPALAATYGQALEPLQAAPVRIDDGRTGAASAEQVLQVPMTEIACGGRAIRPTYAEDLRIEATRPLSTEKPATALSFSVSQDGRTRDIRPLPVERPSDIVVIPNRLASDQDQAVLAAWRFADGPHDDCRLTIRYVAKTVAQADKGDLFRYFAVTRTRGPMRDAVAARLAGAQADCGGDRRGNRAPRNVSFPDNKVGQRPPPGGRAWTVLRWNIDAQGRSVDVETLGSSGDTAFDAETRRAVSETVVEGGAPLRGCVYNFYRNGERLPAPEMPQRQDDPLKDCPAEVDARFQARAAPESFPAAFRERGVEGWAVVRFDLATWGQVGNVEVVDAQPAAAFGDAARRMIQSGRAAPADTAAVRCTVPIRYIMPGDGQDQRASQAEGEGRIATD